MASSSDLKIDVRILSTTKFLQVKFGWTSYTNPYIQGLPKLFPIDFCHLFYGLKFRSENRCPYTEYHQISSGKVRLDQLHKSLHSRSPQTFPYRLLPPFLWPQVPI